MHAVADREFYLSWAEANVFGFVCDLPLVCAFSKAMVLCILAHWSLGRCPGWPGAGSASACMCVYEEVYFSKRDFREQHE
jgi:hypothetical protein